ncbi:serine hydrolase domain-containing protein [Streptomyces sp. NPDC060035]|uniref:serine hydrolase domain-containing protein n=1 Tax=Streptomyces sp. NPDC060035 TaxID=3347044 RepID=UPI0036AB8F84
MTIRIPASLINQLKLLHDKKRSLELYGETIARGVGAFKAKYNIPGISVAISRHGRLEYAEAFGWTRLPSLGESPALTETNTFRSASISKIITAACIMRLVQDKQLKLDHTIFGSSGVLGTTYGTKSYTGYTTQQTIRQLLNHTSGWSNLDTVGAGLDPMFTSAGMNRSQIIDYMLDQRPPMRQPGLLHEYSNFGYCLLGRVIEKVTGKTYEQYAKEAILSKCGISRMHIGTESRASAGSDEVHYYAEDPQDPYKLRVSLFDSHGGWVASPIDLLKLEREIGVFSPKTGILSVATKSEIATGSTDAPGYGLGLEIWLSDTTIAPYPPPGARMVKYAGHSGWMIGTMGFMMSRMDGYSFAFLANKQPMRQSGEPRPFDAIAYIRDEIIWPALASASGTSYESYDLFPLYEK